MGAIARLKEHPKGFWFVFWGELAERASFYGMRAILAMYLVTILGYHESGGASIVQFFIAACYVAPLLGGWIADRFLGRYRTILYFATPYILGHLLLGGIQERWAMFAALGLLALGSGSIKPNTSTLMGKVYEHEGKQPLLTEAFSYFYAAINVGALISMFFLPGLRDKYGYGVAFAIPAALMAVSFVVFAAGKRYYPEDRPRLELKKEKPTRERQIRTLKRIAPIFALIAVFWLVYDQAASTWIYFAKDHMDLMVFKGVRLAPDRVGWTNSLFIIFLTPVFNWMWETWKKRRGGSMVPDTTKMLIGFGIVFVCMAGLATLGFVSAFHKPNIWWEIVATFVITLSELCISVVGLEFAYTQALPGTKSTVTAAFLFTVTIGDFVGGFFDKLYDKALKPGPYFLVQTVIVGVAGLLFIVVARRFNQSAGPGPDEPAVAA